MNIKEKVYSALNASTALTNLLAKDAMNRSIYHCRSPSAKKYPVLVYSMTKDEPAVIADGVVLERRVTIRISILTKDGDYEKIFWEIWKVMIDLGFMFVQSAETVETNDIFAKSIDFRIGLGVNETNGKINSRISFRTIYQRLTFIYDAPLDFGKILKRRY